MKVRLISASSGLHRMCREALLAFQDQEWDFGMVRSPEQAQAGDLIIWDVVPGLTLPEQLNFEQEKTNIFLVDRQRVIDLLEKLPLAVTSILLKPVNERLLHELLEHILSRRAGQGDQLAARLGQLRFDRDELLQTLLVSHLRLQEFDQDRMYLVAQCAHEFRAPLMAVYGYCGMLLDKRFGPLTSEQSRILERMRNSSRRLSRMTVAMSELGMGR